MGDRETRTQRGRWPLRLLAVFAAVLALVPVVLGPAGAFPGANGKIAFVRGSDVVTIDSNGGSAQTLASGSDPAFSPDGTTVAFSAGGDLKTIPTIGGSVESVVNAATDPAWSPDGTSIAFVRGGDIVTIVRGTANETNVTGALGVTEEQAPAWSPDGTRIAFAAKQGGSLEIFSVDPSGGSLANLSNTAGDDTAPAWSPDGDRLAFVNGGDVYLMNDDGTAQIRLTNTTGASAPAWSPDGTQVVFSRNGDIYRMSPTGGPATQLTTDGAAETAPDWGTGLANDTPPGLTLPAGAPPLADGSVLGVAPGTWVAVNPPVTTTYQWQRCNAAGQNCADIAGATSETYELASADVGSTIRVREIATSSDGTASATTDVTPVVVALAPSNLSPPPPISGTASVGQTLTVSAGTWKGTTPMTFTYQWKRCDANGAGCANIAGATGTTYVATSGDVASTLRVTVTATNGVGVATIDSSPTEAIRTAAPSVDVKPVVSGTARVGSSLSTTTGTWFGVTPFTYTYQWRRCNASGQDCTDIAGARSSSYSITSADVGFRLGVNVRATNGAGSATEFALSSGSIESLAPDNTTRPTISGTPRVGSTLSGSNGTWTGTQPITFSYQWMRCDTDGDNCADIAGATTNRYVPTTADVGRSLVIEVTGKNSGGTTSEVSNETSAVTATSTPTSTPTGTTRPATRTLPSISGTPRSGQTLVATAGTWNGTTPMTFGYLWQRCDTTLRTCTSVTEATTSTLKLAAADVGKRLRVVVTAANGAGTTTATSPATAAVTAAAATTPGIRRVSGTARNDRLTGGRTVDVILGGAGNDVLLGRGGNDRLTGGAGRDRLSGEAGNDLLRGGPGNDVLAGGGGNDRVHGDGGNDRLTGGAGLDTLNGGAGRDTIDSADGARDTVDCGAGRDTVVADRIDVVRGCEKVTRRAPASDRRTAARFQALLEVASWTSGLLDSRAVATLIAEAPRP
jgi:Ca2+-binding RTX toxin-like protein